MLHGSRWRFPIAAWLFAQAAVSAGSGPTVMTVDAADSQVLIQVGKAGLFGFAGHAHEVAAADVHGQVVFDPMDLSRASVSLEFAAAALHVTGRNEPPADVGEVQRVMLGDRVLDVERFPTIGYRSRRVSVSARTAAAADLLIEGDLDIARHDAPVGRPRHRDHRRRGPPHGSRVVLAEAVRIRHGARDRGRWHGACQRRDRHSVRAESEDFK